MGASRWSGPLAVAAASVVLVGAVALIYRDASQSYFFNDDFHWLQGSCQFAFRNFFELDRYNHFYRPVIEIYFALGRTLFGCNPQLFHWASIGLHLLTALVVFLLARQLEMPAWFAYLAALLFAVQPGHAEAVAWIGAITDLLPAFWYLLALWWHLRFLQGGHPLFYALNLGAFTLCLLTHESSATLLPMMVALDVLLRPRGDGFPRSDLARRLRWYAPFAALLAGYLAIAFVVNSRSYLIQDGYYGLGWHAPAKVLDYIVAMVVWERDPVPDATIVLVLLILLIAGTPRVRFFTLWIVVALFPVLFFTWGIASRYLYLPAAAFALLVAELLFLWHRQQSGWIPARAKQVAIVIIAGGLSIRFGVFASKASEDFRQRTRPYEALAAAVQRSPRGGDGTVAVERNVADEVPPLYLEPAVRVALCDPALRVLVH
jgi:hypothetical protein